MHNPFICNFCTKDLEKQNDDGNLGQSCTNLTVSHKSNGEGHINQDSTLPPLCDLDMGVIESLPRNLLLEINDLYGGMLISLMSKHKGKSADIVSLLPTSSGSGGGVTYEEKVTLLTSLAPSRQCTVDNREHCHIESAIKKALRDTCPSPSLLLRK